jgi:acyl-CoA thioesterase
LPLAEQTAREMREMLGLRRALAAGTWKPRVVVVKALQPGGIEDLLSAIEAHEQAIGPGQRLRQAAAASSPAQGAAPAAMDAAAWRARLASLAERDGLCATLGISVLAGGPGRAEVAMTVDARHMNFNGGCHGGAIFALADSAFGLASNSHGPVAVGIDAHITFQTGAAAGDRLVARASEMHRTRRVAVYRIDVIRREPGGAETAVSCFTGTVYIKR